MNIELRTPELSDGELILSWRNEPLVRKFSKSQELILEGAHREWLKDRVSSLHLAPFFIVWLEEYPVGYIRFDSVATNEFDISYLVDPTFRGQGLGIEILVEGIRELREAFPKSILNAWVSNLNFASQKNFESLGFDLVEIEENFRKYQELLK